MDIVKFFSENWVIISGSPTLFVTCSLLFFLLGLGLGKFVYGNLTTIYKARLEKARDDLADFEKKNAQERENSSFMQNEVAALRAEVESIPTIHVGQIAPDSNQGKDGDIYLQVESSQNTEPSGKFFLTPPVPTYSQAIVKANTLNKHVFMVIYDPSHPRKSKLSYSLGYFLEYQTTRNLVEEYFVTALVPNTDESAAKLVPNDDPLENCRWVVLDKNGNVIRSEGVYANPEEGLKRTREVVSIIEQ